MGSGFPGSGFPGLGFLGLGFRFRVGVFYGCCDGDCHWVVLVQGWRVSGFGIQCYWNECFRVWLWLIRGFFHVIVLGFKVSGYRVLGLNVVIFNRFFLRGC